MTDLVVHAALLMVLLMSAVAMCFFVLTRGALIWRSVLPAADEQTMHIYPIYSNLRLIRLIDYQFVVSAILLFHYHRLVRRILAELARTNLHGRTVLITSCAFGNAIPEFVRAALEGGAARVLVTDLIRNELVHAAGKLAEFGDRVSYIVEDATALRLEEQSVDVNIMFFLLHELPSRMKRRALEEAGRVVSPGGTFLLAEFHYPRARLLRVLGWLYFKVYEPYGLELWHDADPVDMLDRSGGWTTHRSTFCHGNFQVVRAKRSADPAAER